MLNTAWPDNPASERAQLPSGVRYSLLPLMKAVMSLSASREVRSWHAQS